jgi:zinc protease
MNAGNPVAEYSLSNGLRVLVWEEHQAPIAAFHTWFNVGSADEEPGKSGMAHLFEHLMFKETSNLAAGAFDRLLEEEGVETNAATWLDWTYYREHLPIQALELVVRLEADRLENMILDENQVKTELDVVCNERLQHVDNDPEGLAYEQLFARHFGLAHPYGHPTIGWMKDIKSLTLEDCLAFHRRYYHPGNATIVVVGDVKADHLFSLIEKYYGHLPAGSDNVHRSSKSSPVGGEKLVLPAPVVAPRLYGLYSGPPLGQAGGEELGVLCEILFNTEGSGLNRILVEEQESVTDCAAWYSGFRHSGTVEFQANLTPGSDWAGVLDTVDSVIRRVLEHGVSEKEIEAARNRKNLNELRASLQVGTRARNLGSWQTTVGDYGHYFKRRELRRQVTPQGLLAVAEQWLDSTTRTVAVLVPQG